MTDQNIPAVTDDDRRQAYEWAKSVESNLDTWGGRLRAPARVILNAVPAPPRPTLADMTDGGRDACLRMQCDTGPNRSVRGFIAEVHPGGCRVIERDTWEWRSCSDDMVTPRPDLPRMEWPSEKKVEDVPPVKVGDVIESADDHRVSALPAGTVLRDLDGEEATKMGGGIDHWRGPGYIPIAGDGTEFGPWTVARLPRKPAPATALPDGWRLADHEDYGRVVVTTTTPNDAGNVYFVFPDSNDAKGHYWHLCAPDRLTYLDADQEGDR